jgi:hypothetical protein
MAFMLVLSPNRADRVFADDSGGMRWLPIEEARAHTVLVNCSVALLVAAHLTTNKETQAAQLLRRRVSLCVVVQRLAFVDDVNREQLIWCVADNLEATVLCVAKIQYGGASWNRVWILTW